jgi:hypothetical protein
MKSDVTCKEHGEIEAHTKFWSIYLEERSYWGEGVGIHVKIKLVWIFGNWAMNWMIWLRKWFKCLDFVNTEMGFHENEKYLEDPDTLVNFNCRGLMRRKNTISNT